jgi:acetoin utilization deacetylase AcuC-like enzyme
MGGAGHPKLQALKVLYSDDMVSDSMVRASPSDRKPKVVSEALLRARWPIELVAPAPTAVHDVCKVHETSFVDDVLHLRRPNGFGSYSESVARSVLYTCGACYDSARAALAEGISSSLTSGFHHAGPRSGRGFCTFNGLMVTAVRLLDEGLVRRLAIIDCDYHYGDGTQAIIDAQNLSNRVLHVSFGRTFRRPEQAAAYLDAVSALRDELHAFAPEVILYQAGADPHIDDPLGGLLTTEQMRERDRTLFTIARELSIPVTWNLAGGYQIEVDGSIPRVVELHLNTFEEALRVWQLL